jgi:hypothetical protein
MTDPTRKIPKTDIEGSEHPPEPSTPPNGPPPPQPEQPIATPDHSFVITGLSGTEPYNTYLITNDEAGILAFMQEAGKQLVELDPLWSYISCKPGERKSLVLPNNQSIVADSFLYNTTVQVVQVLRDALEAPKPATPCFVFTTGLSDSMKEHGAYPINPEAQKQKDV